MKADEMTDREFFTYGFKRLIEEQQETQAALNRIADQIEKGNKTAAHALEMAINKSAMPLTDALLQIEARLERIDAAALVTQNNVIRILNALKDGAAEHD